MLATCACLPVAALLLRKRLRLPLRAFGHALMPPAMISLAMAAAVWAIDHYALPPMRAFVELAVLIPAGAIIYAALFALWGRSHLRELLHDLAPILPAFIARRVRGQPVIGEP